ncbi:MAG: RNA polymerase sigma factor [Eubacterium sp.]|nr:RNA polymerase sigma factor [Eubacterium sp.]
MKKNELLNLIDGELLEKLFGFCYGRTRDSYEAQELCSDIVFALIKAADTEGEIDEPYPFIWRVARNVYADFSNDRKRHAEHFYEGDPNKVLPLIANHHKDDNSPELLNAVYHRIAFLTKAYREVMIMFYLDGMSTAEIAKRQNISETAVRQRLFSARNKVRSEVKEMTEINNKPVALDKINYVIWGDGDPLWGDPNTIFNRVLSKHIVWLCRKKPMTSIEISKELGVPTIYVEDELEVLAYGANGKYGLLRRLDNGRYALNFILLDKDEMKEAAAICTEHIPTVCDIIYDYIEKRKNDYLAFPYLNKNVDLNLVLWQQVYTMARAFADNVETKLWEKYFSDRKRPDRPFSVYGYVDYGKYYGGGWDSVDAENVCGYTKVHLVNIYNDYVKKHFGCGLNVSKDTQIQLALRAINGLNISSLNEAEKEHAAKAVECGYLYREGDMLYTKILVSDMKDKDRMFRISRELSKGYFEAQAQETAEKLYGLIRKIVPDYLLDEWRFFNNLANSPVFDSLIEVLIEKGILTPPVDRVGAEGCWISVAE